MFLEQNITINYVKSLYYSINMLSKFSHKIFRNLFIQYYKRSNKYLQAFLKITHMDDLNATIDELYGSIHQGAIVLLPGFAVNW